jgi:uncharacterized membrane protein
VHNDLDGFRGEARLEFVLFLFERDTLHLLHSGATFQRFEPERRGLMVDAPRGEDAVKWTRDWPGWGVWALLVFTVVALLGYGVFGMNPGLIPRPLLNFWRISFGFFAQFHILIGGIALGMALLRWSGIRWIPALVSVYLLSFAAESIGTGSGFPFGLYEYTSYLGPRLGDRVPWVIPLSWFLMVVPSWVLARATFPVSGGFVPRVLFAAVILTVWDVALDPAMAYQPPFYWRWIDTGPYYGMPLINLAGWVGVGIVLMVALEATGVRRWGAMIPTGWAAWYWGVTVFMPLGMLILKGLWGAVLATAAGCLLVWVIHRSVVARRMTQTLEGRVQ